MTPGASPLAERIGRRTQRVPRLPNHYAKSSWRMGRRRMRLPVAWKMALHTAGAIPGVLASPAPPEAFWLGTMWTSTAGIPSMRNTSYRWKLLCCTRPRSMVMPGP